MKLEEIKNSPFYAVEVGATITDAHTGFGATVIKSPITKFIEDCHQTTHMTGESSYVYSDNLNQGSLAIAGSYGVSGVSKLEAGLTVYAGKSSASSSKNIALEYYLQILSGIEYINFTDLSVMDLVNSLMEGPKNKLLLCLDYFTKIQTIIRDEQIDLLKVIAGDLVHPTIINLMEQWYKSINSFHRDYGNGMVAGVIWGGIGEVKLNIESAASESKWKYGASGKFSYASINKSLTIAAAYDGANSNRNSKVNVKVSTEAIGEVVTKQVTAWADMVNKKAFEEICNISLLNSAPPFDKKPDIPAVPDFIKPNKEKSVTDLFEKIGDLKSLEAYAKAQAYEKAKKDNPDLTLEEFLKNADQKTDTGKIENLENKIKSNAIDTLKEAENTQAKIKNDVALENIEHKRLEKAANGLSVLGTWIINWSDLFPWLATGYNNEINENDNISLIIQKQVMLQDLIALRNLYLLFANSAIKDSSTLGIEDFQVLSKSFSDAITELQQNFEKDDVIKMAKDKLNRESLPIYEYWNENYFLRSAELGFGISIENKLAPLSSISEVEDMDKYFLKLIYPTYACIIKEPKDYSSFHKSITGIPLITPGKKVYLMGQNNMFLSGIKKENQVIFSRDIAMALEFKTDKVNKKLYYDELNINLYPIQFKHAEGLEWNGRIISNNVAANKDILRKINALKNDLAKQRNYSYSSDFFTQSFDWTPETCYSLQSLRTQYFGLIPSIGNIFKS